MWASRGSRESLVTPSCYSFLRLTIRGFCSEQLLGTLFPHDEDVTPAVLHGWLTELEAAEMIMWRARNDGAPVVQIVNWQRHQRVVHPHKPVLEASLLGADSDESRAALARLAREPREDGARPARTDHTTILPNDLTTVQPSAAGSRKPRAKPEGEGFDWMKIYALAWDARMEPGMFPFGRAAKPLRQLEKLGHAPSLIAERLGFYLKRKGVPYPQSDTERDDWQPAVFRPDFAAFAQAFGQFDGLRKRVAA